MQRLKVYDVPHKGLRNILGQLSFLAGKTNYNDPQEVEALCSLGRDLFTLLDVHAADENTVTLTELESRCTGSSKHDMDDHEQLHIVQHRLEQLLQQIHEGAQSGSDVAADGAEFYLALSEFQGIYLQHTAEEERITQPLLWKHFTDEELLGHRGKIMSNLSPQVLLLWFRYSIPAQSPAERAGLLSGFKRMAPEPFFNQAMGVIKDALTEQEYSILEKALA